MRSRRSRRGIACLWATWLALTPATALAANPSYPADYLVFEADADGNLELVFMRRVQLGRPPGARRTISRRRSASGSRMATLRLRGRRGEQLFRDELQLNPWIRGEFHGADHGDGIEIEHHRFEDPRRALVLRVPAEAGARLEIEGAVRGNFSLDAATAGAPQLPLAGAASPAPSVVLGASSGGLANRVNLLVMGDGYTASEQSSFEDDAATLVAGFFSVTPYAEYANYVNVITLFTPSTESGADHPPYDSGCSGNDPSCCSDGTASGDPLSGTYADTVFDARFCSWQVHRLLTVDTGKVFAAAAAVPDWDEIIVLVNDSTYGGSGGAVAVGSMHPSSIEVTRHEYAHSYAGLADEYESAFPFPACSDLGDAPCEPNVTDETAAGQIKWSPWIDASTPVPTPEVDPAHNSSLGLFEGARYQSSGMYRPRISCRMRYLGAGFCELCSQTYVQQLYADGIDPIEPGSESPAAGAAMAVVGWGRRFSADLLGPVGGPPLAVSWLLDGVPVDGADQSSFRFVPAAVGTYELTLSVEDVTDLVHADQVGDSLSSTRSWTVTASAAPVPGLAPGGAALLGVALTLATLAANRTRATRRGRGVPARTGDARRERP